MYGRYCELKSTFIIHGNRESEQYEHDVFSWNNSLNFYKQDVNKAFNLFFTLLPFIVNQTYNPAVIVWWMNVYIFPISRNALNLIIATSCLRLFNFLKWPVTPKFYFIFWFGDNVSFIISKKNIAKILKAEIARQIWTEEGFYRTINPLDNELNTALKELK